MMGWGLSEQGWRKGPWTADEDKLLSEYVKLYGEGRWSSVASTAGLNRSGKSCRLRWVNYLRPGLKRGQITPLEEGIIIELHALWGNKWSTIARYLPGRTDNEIKNYWRTHFKNKDKSSHQTKEKQKAEVLKQKRQNIEQKQELEQHNDDDTKMVDSNHNTAGDGEMLQDAQRQRQMLFMYPILEDQCLPVMYQDVASCADSVTEDGGLWGGLWDLDDPYTSNYCNKMAMQNQAANLSFGRGGPN